MQLRLYILRTVYVLYVHTILRMADAMEKTLLMKQEAFVYRIPTGQSAEAGWKANAWSLDKPDWRGKLRLVTKVGEDDH